MQVMIIQPPHSFEEADLPPMPGVKAQQQVLRCKHCGIMGYSLDGQRVSLFHSPDRANRARNCMGQAPSTATTWYARVTSTEAAHLTPGALHRVLPAPDSDSLRVAGVWVDSPQGPVKLLPGEFEAVKPRVRRRKGKETQNHA